MAASGQKTSDRCNGGGGYYAGQRRRRKLREQQQKRLKFGTYMPSLQAAVDAQNRLGGGGPEALFGNPDRLRQHRSRKKPIAPSLLSSPELQLRFLNPSDIPDVKRLCGEWFPIEYPDCWYKDITCDERFYSVGAVYRGQIIGLIVAEIRYTKNLPKEDSEILASSLCGRNRMSRIGYILSIGVVKEYRANGVASFLLDNLVAHLTNPAQGRMDVGALYLHVLTTNNEAISFYENRGFRVHLFLPCYYAVKEKRRDGFTYVLYLNGGHPTWTMVDYLGHCFQGTMSSVTYFNPWHWAKSAIKTVLHIGGLIPIWPRLRQIAHSSTATVFS